MVIVFTTVPLGAHSTELADAGLNVIPYPQEVTMSGKGLTISRPISIVIDSKATAQGRRTCPQPVGRIWYHRQHHNQAGKRGDCIDETRLPKGLSTTDNKYFFQQDRARHYANRTPDMTYHIVDEEHLDMEGYLEALRKYMEYYETEYLNGK